ncbi:MAG: tungstate ABC transporter substrate-binding protein WtpA [Bacteroidales bacterium]|nr:tungstate ABC transporter substrate-binding protein WtpA [Bacteroidales bacterium]
MRKISLISFAIAAILLFSCNNAQNKSANKQLIIFHAGSLSLPLKQMKEEFQKENPKVEILMESAGSVACARKITDLKKDCDIMASADYTIIDNMLIPNYASWNIKFASNEMAIVYHESSRYANEINAENWPEILMKEDVIYGRSDPNSDPCGYRTLLTAQLAENYYHIDGFENKLKSKDKAYVRPKEVDLLALLESNTIDYIFLYRSVAEQHHLKYIILPDSINLKNPDLADFYKTAKVDITGKTPGSLTTKTGEPVVYGITVLNNTPNKAIALKFINFVLSKQGGVKIMEENGQPSMVPSYSETYNAIPEKLKPYANPTK